MTKKLSDEVIWATSTTGEEFQCVHVDFAREQQAEIERLRIAFRNFHRLLCERFEYGHDEIDWERDQLSLIEWIAKRTTAEPPVHPGPDCSCYECRQYALKSTVQQENK